MIQCTIAQTHSLKLTYIANLIRHLKKNLKLEINELFIDFVLSEGNWKSFSLNEGDYEPYLKMSDLVKWDNKEVSANLVLFDKF